MSSPTYWAKKKNQCLTTEAARSRFDPGNRLPWDVKILFKTQTILYNGLLRQVNVFTAHSAIPAWALRLAAVVAGARGSYYRMDVGWSAEKLSLWCGAFLTFSFDSVSRHQSDSEFGIASLKKDKERVIRGTLRKYQGSEQNVSVCALVNIKWFD
jgi:hypothetical protein